MYYVQRYIYISRLNFCLISLKCFIEGCYEGYLKNNTAKGDRPNDWCKVNIKQEAASGPIKPNVDDCNCRWLANTNNIVISL